jgi:hypothetical protein
MVMTGMKVHTTRTGSPESGVADEGFTTFRVRPWKKIQLCALEETMYPSQSSSAGVATSYVVLKILPITLINSESGGFAVLLDIMGAYIRLNGFWRA